MKPPRLPGTEKFRFCDKKFEQPKVCSLGEGRQNGGSDCGVQLNRQDSILLSLHTRALSNHSLCSCSEKSENKNSLLVTDAVDHFISHVNIPATRMEHKRKPNLPISSRLTSRVYTLTHCIARLEESDVYYRNKAMSIYSQYKPVLANPLLVRLSRTHFPEEFNCLPLLSLSTQDSSLEKAKCRLHVDDNLIHASTNLMINSTSHTSLMSDESSTSISSVQPPECEDPSPYHSFSSSPIDHWAKHVRQSRLSTSSQSSWEDGSGSSEVT